MARRSSSCSSPAGSACGRARQVDSLERWQAMFECATNGTPAVRNGRRLLPLGLNVVILAPLTLVALVPLVYALLNALSPAPPRIQGNVQPPPQQPLPAVAAPLP